MTFDQLLALIGPLGGLAGLAALLSAILTGPALSRKAHSEAVKTAGDTVVALAGSMSETLARLESETEELRTHVTRLEVELADSRRSVLEMTDAIAELTTRIDAALDLLHTTKDPAAEAAAAVLKKPRRRRSAAKKK